MVQRGTSATTGPYPRTWMRPGGGARNSPALLRRIRLSGRVPVVALVPRFTAEEAAEVLAVVGAFRTSRQLNLLHPSGLLPDPSVVTYHVIGSGVRCGRRWDGTRSRRMTPGRIFKPSLSASADRSRDELLHHMRGLHAGEFEIEALRSIGEALVVDAEQVQHRGSTESRAHARGPSPRCS